MSAPPTTRAAFCAGMRYALQELADSFTPDGYYGARRRVDHALRGFEYPGGFAEVVGEAFFFDDAEQCGGYFRAHPEHQA